MITIATAAVARERFRNSSVNECHHSVPSGLLENSRIVPSRTNAVRMEIQICAGGSTSAGSWCASATMLVTSSKKCLQAWHSERCWRAAAESGAKPSCSKNTSNSLHCIAHHPAERTLDGFPPRFFQTPSMTRIAPILAQPVCPVCVFAIWRSVLACSRTSSCSKSRKRVRALCNCDLELPTEHPMMSAISLCS
jgi:hypothetical protein